MSQPAFSFSTTAEEAATVFTDDIQGKNVLITGTSLNGIGFETARALAKHANLLVITGQNPDRLKIAEDTIRKEMPSANLRPLILDLSSLAAVRKAAAEVNAYLEPLHALIHNAAATTGSFKLTADNLESQMATNHIGPFLLTKLLAPKILAARTAHYTPRSKSANVLSAIELSKVQRADQCVQFAPRMYFSHFHQHSAEGDAVTWLQKMGVLDADGQSNNEKYTFKTIPQGAATTVVAAFNPTLNNTPGAYLTDCVVANEVIAPHSSDPVNAEKLWTLTEKIIGETFAF
ncbi:NAD-P-binding protein [Mycena leptocephala]|nr:NAD-P-binding protein [Mycena leptocephala]